MTKATYQFESDGSFSITNYNHAPPFSSFLAGIAGPFGIPMWAFYVNRGQGICSFGLRDKDHSIMEFLSANWAYQLVFNQGFRTLIKVRDGRKEIFYEPFGMDASRQEKCTQQMSVYPHGVSFKEINKHVGLACEVDYFTMPQEPSAALIRTLRVENLARKTREVEVLDGLPLIVPCGLDNGMLKTMRFVAQSFTIVTGLERHTPCFRMKVKGEDSALIEEVDRMNFCFGFEARGQRTLLPAVIERSAVFGSSTACRYPEGFMQHTPFRVPGGQIQENHLPSAMLFFKRKIAPGDQRTFHSFFGCISGEKELEKLVRQARKKDFVSQKRAENSRITARVTQPCATVSSHSVFNAYARQNLLDNVLRGGSPTTFGNREKPLILSLYSRKHGDLERDYNWYVLEPTPLSQGEGNFRDVNQNRRNDVFINPDVREENILTFFNLIQLDGNNPLVVKPTKLICRKSASLKKTLVKLVGSKWAGELYQYITREFELGHLFNFLISRNISPKVSQKDFLDGLLRHARSIQDSTYSMGYWTDHWTYNLDLIDSFRGMYPDKYVDLLYRKKSFVYCDTHAHVRPRSEKYFLWRGQPMQLESVEEDAEKARLIQERTSLRYAVRADHGRGRVYHTTLAQKLLSLALVKLASLDSHGMGIEMESERPGWNDALNGLPGQFGSSTCETFELKRLLELLAEAIELAPGNYVWNFPVEVHSLFHQLLKLLKETKKDTRRSQFHFWDKATAAKETFRDATRDGLSGWEKKLSQKELSLFVEKALNKVQAGLKRAFDKKTGLYHTYFRFEVGSFKEKGQAHGQTTFQPTDFKRKPLPAYLEGQVHALRTNRQAEHAARLVEAVKRSGLYDPKLRMYKVNDSLETEAQNIGRARTFARGWLENESIWLHMEYKYLLEILRAGLAEEFYEELKHCGVPFLDPAMYGRSTTENCSFLVSSVHPNEELIGKGFMARLSGATAEFIHIWLLMCAGQNPFRVNAQGKLEAVFSPSLAAWLFTKHAEDIELLDDTARVRKQHIPAKSFAFMFLDHTLVIYRQRGKPKNTYGPRGATIQSMQLAYDDGQIVNIDGDTIPAPHAVHLRERKIRTVTAALS